MVQSIRQLEALRDEWDALAARFATPLLDHDWFISCAEAFCVDQDLRILTIRESGALVGVAPLMREWTPSGHRLMLLGASRLYEPSGWLFEAPRILAELADQAIRFGDPMVLQRIPADSPICLALRELPRSRALTVIRTSGTSLAVPTTLPWETYFAGLSSLIRVNLPRLRRKAERTFGRMTVQQLSPRPADVDALLETFVNVEGSGWKARKGSALVMRDDLRSFFRRYAHRAAERGRLRVTTLSFGSDVAAVELSVEAYNRIWQLKIGYNHSLAPYYPGLQLTAFTIRSAFEHGLEAYEFLGSAERWEERWRPDVRHYQLLVAYPLSVGGLLGAARDLAGAVRARTQQALRPAAGEARA